VEREPDAEIRESRNMFPALFVIDAMGIIWVNRPVDEISENLENDL
jgi:hypothetical protein